MISPLPPARAQVVLPPGAADPRAWSEYASSYDLPPYDGTTHTYLVATTQRTGSHYLAHLLARVGTVGVPFEYLNHYRSLLELDERGWSRSVDSHLQLFTEMRRRRTGSAGWFGVKAHWHTWQSVTANAQVRDVVRPDRFVYLSRVDVVAQAVSLAIAEQTWVWVDVGQERHPATYSRRSIEGALQRIDTERAAWESYFAHQSIDVLRLTYEGLIANPDGSVDRVLRHLGMGESKRPFRNMPLPHPRSDGLVERWSQRYRTGS